MWWASRLGGGVSVEGHGDVGRGHTAVQQTLPPHTASDEQTRMQRGFYEHENVWMNPPLRKEYGYEK